MATQPEVPRRVAPPVPSRRAPVVVPPARGPPPENGSQPTRISSARSSLHSSSRSSTSIKGKRERPVITVLEARPMNEVSFRGSSPTPTQTNAKSDITVISAKPMSEVGFRDEASQNETVETQDRTVEMRPKRSAPPPRPASMPSKPLPPASQPPIYKPNLETQEEMTPNQNLITFSPRKENQAPTGGKHGEQTRRPAPARPSRPMSLRVGRSGSTDLISPSDSSGYASQVNTCESQPSLSSDGTDEAIPVVKRRQLGVQVLPVGLGGLKQITDRKTLTVEQMEASEGKMDPPIASPRASRKVFGPPAPKPRGHKTPKSDDELEVPGKSTLEQNEDSPAHKHNMVLPPMAKPRSPSPRIMNQTDDHKDTENQTIFPCEDNIHKDEEKGARSSGRYADSKLTSHERPSSKPTSPERPSSKPTSPERPSSKPTSPGRPYSKPTSPGRPYSKPTSPERPSSKPTSPERPSSKPTSPERLSSIQMAIGVLPEPTSTPATSLKPTSSEQLSVVTTSPCPPTSPKHLSPKSPSPKPSPPVIKPKPMIKPKPAIKPKPKVAAKPKPTVATNLSVDATAKSPPKVAPKKPVNKFTAIVDKPSNNDSFYEDKPLNDSFYEGVSSTVNNTKASQKEEDKNSKDTVKSLYPDLKTVGDDGTIYPQLSKVAPTSKHESVKLGETFELTEPTSDSSGTPKPEILKEDIRPPTKKRPTIIKAKRVTIPDIEKTADTELVSAPKKNDDTSFLKTEVKDDAYEKKDKEILEEKDNRKSVDEETQGDDTKVETAPSRKPTIIRPSRPRPASVVSPTEPTVLPIAGTSESTEEKQPNPTQNATTSVHVEPKKAPSRPKPPSILPHKLPELQRNLSETDENDPQSLSKEDLNRVKSYLVRSDSVSSTEQAENIVNEIRIRQKSERKVSVGTESLSGSECSSLHGDIGNMVDVKKEEQNVAAMSTSNRPLTDTQEEEDIADKRKSRGPAVEVKMNVSENKEVVSASDKRKSGGEGTWVPPGAVRVMGAPPPLPRSGPVAVSTPDLRISHKEEVHSMNENKVAQNDHEPSKQEHDPVPVLPMGPSHEFNARRSTSMHAIQSSNTDNNQATEGSKFERSESQKEKPKRPPSRPAPCRPPPAKAPPARPSVVPRKVPGEETGEGKVGEPGSRPNSGPPKPPRAAGPVKAPHKPPPPSSPPAKSPPGLPSRPGPGHPLYHYMVQGPHGIALFDFTGSAEDELTFKSGDVIELEEQIGEGWMVGRNVDQKGMFPINFIDVIEAPPISNTRKRKTSSISEGALPTGSGPRCIARFDYEPAEEGDLSFIGGEVIQILEHVGDDWLKGSINGHVGIFPLAFVEIVEDLPSESPKVSQSPLAGTPPSSSLTARKEELTHQHEDEPYCIAEFDYTSEDPTDLHFAIGDKIRIEGYVSEEWIRGNVNGKSGMFPKAYVTIIKDIEDPTVTSPAVAQAEGAATESTGLPISAVPASPVSFGKAIALYDFDGESEEDLSLKIGDEVIMKEEVGEDWFKGSLAGSETVGMFPAAFVKVLCPIKS